MWQGIFPSELSLSADSYAVRTAPHMQLSALTSVRMLKVSRIGSHSVVWTHEGTAHTGPTLEDEMRLPKSRGLAAILLFGHMKVQEHTGPTLEDEMRLPKSQGLAAIL